MSADAPAEFIYRLAGKSANARPGAHNSNSRGAGMNFVTHARLMDQPDPRRLDLRASLGDIKGDWLVRINQQRSATSVVAIVDVAASMHFGAEASKLQVAADFLHALAYSTGGMGDAVGLQVFDQNMRGDLHQPIRFGRGLGPLMADCVRHSTPSSATDSSNAQALADCATSVAGKASLVFIVSDFHWPLSDLSTLLDPLANARVVPLVVWDRAETEPPTRSQLLSARQMGGGNTRHLWINDNTRQQWRDKVAQRRAELAQAFAPIDATPFYISDGFNPEALSQYFLEPSH